MTPAAGGRRCFEGSAHESVIRDDRVRDEHRQQIMGAELPGRCAMEDGVGVGTGVPGVVWRYRRPSLHAAPELRLFSRRPTEPPRGESVMVLHWIEMLRRLGENSFCKKISR